MVQRLQRFPPALSRQGSQSEIKHGSFAQGKIVTTSSIQWQDLNSRPLEHESELTVLVDDLTLHADS